MSDTVKTEENSSEKYQNFSSLYSPSSPPTLQSSYLMDNDCVTYRELLAVLEQRDMRIYQRVDKNAERIESLDNVGTRGVQRVSDRLDQVIKDLEEHSVVHKQNAQSGISNKQWLVTTLVSFGAMLLGIVTAFGGGHP